MQRVPSKVRRRGAAGHDRAQPHRYVGRAGAAVRGLLDVELQGDRSARARTSGRSGLQVGQRAFPIRRAGRHGRRQGPPGRDEQRGTVLGWTHPAAAWQGVDRLALMSESSLPDGHLERQESLLRHGCRASQR